ncbi:MAG: COX15/CtaA family protein [Chloroflexota bacterium]|nr:MAG: hypothetical protein DIU68_18465 [Chloroflexota bacterium]
MQTHPASPGRRFPALAFAVAFLTVGLIVFGAVVRVTDSGLGCGTHWPLCNGTIFPPLDNLTAWIEWLHRLFAILIGLLGLLMLYLAFRDYRGRNRLVVRATVVAALLFLLQSALGAIVVWLELPPTSVTLHLGTAMLLVAALFIAAIASIYRPQQRYPSDRFTALAYVTAALSFVIILTGALVRGSGAMLACVDWPLCNGTLFPFSQGQLATIHMLHRFAVAGLGLALVLLVAQALSDRKSGSARTLAVLALVAYLVQAAIGALYVLSVAAPLWGALHVLFAALTWTALVVLCLIETLNSRAIKAETEGQWQPHSEAILNS